MHKKVLFVATVYKFLGFERSDMTILKNMGFEIHTASNMYESEWLKDDGFLDDIGVVKHQIDFSRSPFSIQSYKAYKQLKELSLKEKFIIIHCHTPVAAAICRIAAIKARKKGTKVLYTDHGFHFHKTSGWKTWIIYYPIEYLLARYTDMILTINKEDYGIISKFPVKDYRYIPGVGVDVDEILNLKVDKNEIRRQYGIPENAFVILSVGEISLRKNQEVIIKALSQIKDCRVCYVICGTGSKQQDLKLLAEKLGIGDRVFFLGFQAHSNVLKLNYAADIGALPSLIEGLGLAGIESLAAGRPLIASGVHGIKDYVIPDYTGITCNPHHPEEFRDAILKLYNNSDYYKKCSANCKIKATEFDIKQVRALMINIYNYLLDT